jgi:hypothetical protein
VLEGQYCEVMRIGIGMARRDTGTLVLRRARDTHRIALCNEDLVTFPEPTLFIHGRTTRQWGFWSEDGKWRVARKESM